MKLRIWIDTKNRQNLNEMVEFKFELEEVGITEKEWSEMSDYCKEVFVKEIAFDKLDWGFEIIE